VARDVASAQRFFQGPVFIIGDPRQAGDEYASKLLWSLQKERIKNPIVLEFFTPPPSDFLPKVGKALHNYNVQISAESHDEVVRRTFGKGYNNDRLEETIRQTLENGCQRFDLFFMVGLAKQNYASVIDTARYGISLMKEFASYRKLHPMISPLAPFIDPGSKVYENPQKYGYHLYCRNLEDHCQALRAPTWKYMLSYETEWLTRDEIVESTYEAALMLNQAKKELGIITAQEAATVESQCKEALKLIHDVDKAVNRHGTDFKREEIFSPAIGAQHLRSSSLCPKKELEWPASSILRSAPRILWGLCPWSGRRSS
jgi:radical SAM superfamily enzyme YgiQ (UPF0313 family)